MTYAVELTAEQMQRVREAEAQGFDVATLTKAAVAGALAALPLTTAKPNRSNRATRSVKEAEPAEKIGERSDTGGSAFARRRLAEIAAATLEERTAGATDLKEFMQNMNAERRRAGARILYPDVKE